MTAPLTPADCDLRDFPRMMVDVPRLMNSGFNSAASRNPIAWMVGHKLWYRAWHQVPAGSLPDDDDELCHLSELGFDVKTWRKVKEIALRNWILCDDGRLYHPTLAEVALEAWIEKLLQRLSSGAGNAKRYGHAFDAAPLNAAIEASAELLHNLNPRSRAADKLKRRQSRPPPNDLPPGENKAPTGSDVGTPPASLETGTGKGNLEERSTDLFVVPATPAPPAKLPPAWKRDAAFGVLWALATDLMRKRAKSAAHAHAAWQKARRGGDGADIIAGMRGYLAKDPDVGRTGGPGLHIWLNNRTFETYAGSDGAAAQGADWPDSRWAMAVDLWRSEGSWGESLGPPPGQPGCRVPSHLLVSTSPTNPQPVRGAA